MNLKDTPIHRKLTSVILLICLVVLTLMSGACIIFEFFTLRQIVENNVSTLGLAVASNSTAALAFDSPADADEILNALKADRHIVAAGLYDANGSLFAKYPTSINKKLLPLKPGKNGSEFSKSYFEVYQAVTQKNAVLGTLYIKSDLEAMYAQLRQFALTAFLLIALSLFVAYLLSNILQKSISQPIIGLMQTARVITEKSDYSVRAFKLGNDELGQLTEAFNQMLSQIETQTIEIKQAEEHLRLANNAAELGTFDMDIISGTQDWDPKCRELFGIYHNNAVSLENDFLMALHEDDRERVLKELDDALENTLGDGSLDMEYRTVGIDDGKLRWIRAKGKVFFNDDHKPVRVLGAVLEITDKKQEELRKNDFIAIISHELKTPLTSIRSYIQILLARAKQDNDSFRINTLTRAEIQAKKMTSMILDFLSLARLEDGKIQLVKEVFNLETLIEDVVTEARFLSPGHNIITENCLDVKINVDKDKIGQVLINLLSNAMKYSAKETTITVGCQQAGNKIKVYVTDQGVGISAKDQIKLFDRFYRVNNDKIKTVSGFGIGLYLVSEILRFHNAKIEVESKENVGSTFSFTLDVYQG